MGENSKLYKDPENSSFQDDWECKGTFEIYHGNEKGSSNQVIITHEEIHTLRQQTSHNLLHKIPPGSRPYVCNECRKGSGQKKSLLSHQKIHTGEKSYEGQQCGKAFQHGPNPPQHQRTHSGKDPMNVKNVKRPLVLFHSLQDIREFILVRNAMNMRMWKNLWLSQLNVHIVLILVKNTINVLNTERLLVTYH